MRFDDSFAVVVSHDGGVPLVRVHGDVDLVAAPTVRRTLSALIDLGEREISLDLEDVQFMDSSGLAVLAEVLRSGTWLTITAASSAARRVLELSGLANLCSPPVTTRPIRAGAGATPRTSAAPLSGVRSPARLRRGHRPPS